MVAMEVNNCYGKSMIAILVTGLQLKVNGCNERQWLLWNNNGCYESN
jgi:hypothetical protein